MWTEDSLAGKSEHGLWSFVILKVSPGLIAFKYMKQKEEKKFFLPEGMEHLHPYTQLIAKVSVARI